MAIGKTNEGLLNGGGTFLSPQEVLEKLKHGGSGSGGSELPAITGADDGKVLTADDGEWVAHYVPKDFIIVNITFDDDNWVMDKTYKEMYDLINNSIPVYGYLKTDSVDDDTDYPQFKYVLSRILEPVMLYKYGNQYRVFINGVGLVSHNDVFGLKRPCAYTFVCDEPDDYPVFHCSIMTKDNCIEITQSL